MFICFASLVTGMDFTAIIGITVLWTIICWEVSGGHFNPAITVTMLLNSKKPKDNLVVALLIMAGQLIGAFAGIWFAWLALIDMDYLGDDREHSIPQQWISILAPISSGYGGYDLGTDAKIGFTRTW